MDCKHSAFILLELDQTIPLDLLLNTEYHEILHTNMKGVDCAVAYTKYLMRFREMRSSVKQIRKEMGLAGGK